jgi:hypothetical protein
MVLYLYAMRRRCAEGRSGGAEVLRRRRGGSELGEAAKRGERRPRHPSGRLGSTGGLAKTPGVEARLLRRLVEAGRSWHDRSAAAPRSLRGGESGRWC